MDTINFRPLVKTDATGLRDVALKSWMHTYKNIYSKEFIIDFINENYSLKAIQNTLDLSKKNTGWNYVALKDNKIVGFITIGKSDIKFRLYRIYLLPKYFGQGIGSKLLDLGENFLRTHNTTKYIVYVHEDNLIGKNFYSKKGFNQIESKNEDNEICLEKKL